MSEYQYYEFLAVDRPLTAKEVAAVRQFSTRADISPTRFVNEYHWGDFKGDVDEFLSLYFDAHVHVTNWGTRRFAFRLPADLVDRGAVAAYAHPSSLDVRPVDGHLVVDLNPETDGGGAPDDGDGNGWMASLAPLRAEVLAGDLRPLFIGWLAGLQLGGPPGGGRAGEDGDDGRPVPPVPAGLGKLTAAQRALCDYLGVDEDLLEVAAADSPPPAPQPDLGDALSRAPSAQKDRWLLDLLGGDNPLAAARIRRQLLGDRPTPPVDGAARTVGELRSAWGELDARRTRERADAAAAAKLKRTAADAAAREKGLADLAKRGDAAWREVDELIGTKDQDGYRKAVALMVDLRAVANRTGDPAAFTRELDRRLAEHRRRPTFMAAARQAGLVVA